MVKQSELYEELRRHASFIQRYSLAKDPGFVELDRVYVEVGKRITDLCYGSIVDHNEETEWGLVAFGCEIEEDLALLKRGFPPKRRDKGYSHIHD